VSSQSVFAFAAAAVLERASGLSHAGTAAQSGSSAVATGIDIPADDLEGRSLGREVGRRAWSRARQYFSGKALR
jgi:hypothetical protein